MIDVERLTLIRLALLPQLARRLDRAFTAVLMQVFIRHDLPTDEFVFKVGAERSRSVNESA